MTEYKFRFKTKAQLDLAQATGYIEDYPIVRFKVTGQKGHVVDFAYKCRNLMAADEFAITHWYDKTFNTKEK